MSKALKTVEPVQVPATQVDPVLSLLERMLTDPSVSIERVDQTFAFYQKVEADRARKEFAAAMVAAQAEMEPIRKDAFNDQTKSKYATFDALDRVARPIYTKHGFAPSYDTAASDKPDHVKVVLTLLHVSGHERSYTQDMPADGKGAKGGDVMTKTHAHMSANTYGKRALLGNAFNLVPTEKKDDDGNAAGGPQPTITDKQVRELEALLEATASDKAKFLAIGGLDTLEDMPASKFESAKAMVMKKLGGKK